MILYGDDAANENKVDCLCPNYSPKLRNQHHTFVAYLLVFAHSFFHVKLQIPLFCSAALELKWEPRSS